MPEQQAQQQLSQEQIKALQEKLKDMSPEELKEFQKKQCIFCQIISGKVQSRKIYEDGVVLAILDVNPANPGHMLIMPREHYSIMPQMPDDEVSHIFTVAKALSNAALRSLEVQGSNIIVANGVAAGQRAQHFMAHLIPRKENDNLSFKVPQKTMNDSELKNIRKILADSLGGKAEETQTVPMPRISRESKVVDAKFKEKRAKRRRKISKENFIESKNTEVKKEPSEEKESESPVSAGKGVDLDDIARMFGAK